MARSFTNWLSPHAIHGLAVDGQRFSVTADRERPGEWFETGYVYVPHVFAFGDGREGEATFVSCCLLERLPSTAITAALAMAWPAGSVTLPEMLAL